MFLRITPQARVAALSASIRRATSSAARKKPFPSITVRSDGVLSANGTFAESQLAYLSPDESDVAELDSALRQANMGVVSHYYMDPQLQGVLAACPTWPHMVTSDSLAMGDMAVKMVKEGGVEAIACLGVDFMAESVRAMLDTSGFETVPVYRLSEKAIGCSLAEAAEGKEYRAWLEKAKNTPNSLHVVYINTSIVTKAEAQHLVPTITCTSSNVVKTVLSAFADAPDVTVWYGPDTYMGENLRTLFTTLSTMPDEKIKELHPAHDQASVKALLQRFEVFPMGNCVVHHMFGKKVADQVRTDYQHALKTAHLEVPGDMFEVANEAALEGRGVVGSTSNILNFIVDETRKAVMEADAAFSSSSSSSSSSSVEPRSDEDISSGGGTVVVRPAVTKKFVNKLSVVLGTEAGMVTPIVREVQKELKRLNKNSNTTPTSGERGGGDCKVEVEIVFPVAAEAVYATGEANKPTTATSTAVNGFEEGGGAGGGDMGGLAVVPGASGGEGCSAAGGCATCPFMKMNTLDALLDLAHKVEEAHAASAVATMGATVVATGRSFAKVSSAQGLDAFLPMRRGATVNGKPVAELGTLPILHMRDLAQNGVLSETLCADIRFR